MQEREIEMLKHKDKIIHLAMAALYIGLAFLSYYADCYKLPVSTKYFVNGVIFCWAAAAFFIKPRVEDAKFCVFFFGVYFLFFAFAWVWSLGLWIAELQSISYIIRGSLNVIYTLTNYLFVCSAVYLFGFKAIYYTLYSMMIANGLCFLSVCASDGIAEVINQYIRLLVTFADDTGSSMLKLELHDMVFGWGAYTVFFMCYKDKKWWSRLIHLAIAAFFFTLSMKRIAMAAVALAVAVHYLYTKMKDKSRRRFLLILYMVVAFAAYIYIWMVHSGAFTELMSRLGINLMGRDNIISYYRSFYEVNPFYLGRGLRFLFQYGQIYEEAYSSLHNVYMELFVELGFWGWFIWLYIEVYLRNHMIGKKFGYAGTTILVAEMIYTMITYMTDNTMWQFPVNSIYRLCGMAWCYKLYTEKRRDMQQAPVVNERELGRD